MLMVLSIISQNERDTTTELVRDNGYFLIGVGCIFVIGYPWYTCMESNRRRRIDEQIQRDRLLNDRIHDLEQ